MDQLLSTDPSDKATVAGIAAEIQAAAGVLHRICSSTSTSQVMVPARQLASLSSFVISINFHSAASDKGTCKNC